MGKHDYSCRIDLRIFGQNINSRFVSDQLKMKSDIHGENPKDAVWHYVPLPGQPKGRDFDRRYSLGECWIKAINFKAESVSLSDVHSQLQYWLRVLTPVSKGIKEIKSAGLWIVLDVSVYLWNSSVFSLDLPYEVVSDLKLAGVDVQIAVHPNGWLEYIEE